MVKCYPKLLENIAVYFDGTNYKELYDNLLYKFTRANVVFTKAGLPCDRMPLRDWVYSHGSFDPFGDAPAYIEVDNFSEKPIIIKSETWVVCPTDEDSLVLAIYDAEKFSQAFVSFLS